MRKQPGIFIFFIALIVSFIHTGSTVGVSAKKNVTTKKVPVLYVGQKKQLTPKKKAKIIWKSSNKKIAVGDTVSLICETMLISKTIENNICKITRGLSLYNKI